VHSSSFGITWSSNWECAALWGNKLCKGDMIFMKLCTWWLMHCSMMLTQIQGQSHRGLKVAKIVDFTVWLLRQYRMHVIERLMMNYNTWRKHLNWNWMFHLWETNFTESSNSHWSPVAVDIACSVAVSFLISENWKQLSLLIHKISHMNRLDYTRL